MVFCLSVEIEWTKKAEKFKNVIFFDGDRTEVGSVLLSLIQVLCNLFKLVFTNFEAFVSYSHLA